MAEEFESRMNPIKIKVKVINYNKPYLNLLITHIDDMNTESFNISYCIRITSDTDYNKMEGYNIISISKVNLTNLKYDENILPELDNYYKLLL